MQLDRLSILKSWRGPLTWLLAALACAASVTTFTHFWRTKADNETIQSLLAHKDITVDPTYASGEVVLARINELIRRDRLDEAQTLLGSTETRMEPRLRALALYNLANERTRQGAEFVRKGDLDHAAALINVAKTEYRLALKIDPHDWNTKYNLDVAMRIVRDLPQADNLSDEEQQTTKKIWTDLPGVPKGLP
jgi:mxaK protein